MKRGEVDCMRDFRSSIGMEKLAGYVEREIMDSPWTWSRRFSKYRYLLFRQDRGGCIQRYRSVEGVESKPPTTRLFALVNP